MLGVRIRTVALAFAAVGLAVRPSAAQEPVDTLRQAFRIPLPPTLEVAARGSRIAPGVSVASPTGFGAEYGDAFIAVGYQARTRIFTRQDGAVAAGFGLGNARDLLGLEVVGTSFGTARTCCRGGISFKVHRVIPWNASLALGWENAILWRLGSDEPATDAGRSIYGAATKVMFLRSRVGDPFSTMTVTVGAGGGRFRRERDVVLDRSTIGPFASVGLRATERVSIIADWTNHDLGAGVSVVPFRSLPLIVTPAFVDLTSRPRFVAGAAFGFNYSGLLF